MATKLFGGKPLFQRILLGILGGVFGYIFGTILATMGIFPSLHWAQIGLFLGVILGAFWDEINNALE